MINPGPFGNLHPSATRSGSSTFRNDHTNIHTWVGGSGGALEDLQRLTRPDIPSARRANIIDARCCACVQRPA